MGIEGSQGNGSMFGVVDSLRNMTSAMEETLRYLPGNFVWPTIVTVSSFSVLLEWGQRDNTTEHSTETVWIIASPEGVKMNANFRPDWPECGASDFDAKIAAEWLLGLTKNWEWSSERGSDGITSSTLRRTSMNR